MRIRAGRIHTAVGPPILDGAILIEDGIITKIGRHDQIESPRFAERMYAAEVTPGAVLPEGFITKDPRFASSKVFHVDDRVHYDHTGKYAAVGSFDYTGP